MKARGKPQEAEPDKGADAPLTSCVTVALPLGAAEPACTETVAESASAMVEGGWVKPRKRR